ncbi:RNA polymerase sigma factor [Mycobacterium sp. ML4]
MTPDETALVASLRKGDRGAFEQLVDTHTAAMLRVARGYVRDPETAEEVVQDTWIAFLKGLGGFEGRSSLRNWLFAVLINVAKARGMRERRHAENLIAAFGNPSVDPSRFRPATDDLPGHWKDPPAAFPQTPEGSVLADEMMTVARRAVDGLPGMQRAVVTMRDILGFDSAEVCELLQISAGNQRVLLHRGRAAARQALEDYLGGCR